MAPSALPDLRPLSALSEQPVRAAAVFNAGHGTPNTPVVQASSLLGTRQCVEIEYRGQRYRLQTTKAGKLILTK
nr:hemin uptake protein HemP [uncultured Rhodoferax sp.]